MAAFTAAKEFGDDNIWRHMKRQMDLETVENIGLRRLCTHMKAVVAGWDGVKGLWHGAIRNENSLQDEPSTARDSSESSSSLAVVETQPRESVKVRELEVSETVAATDPVGTPSVPGAFPTEEADEPSLLVAYKSLQAELTTEVSVDIRDLVRSESPSPTTSEVFVPTELSTVAVVGEQVSVTCRHSSITSAKSLSSICKSDITRAPSPDWIPAPEGVRLSQALTVVEPEARAERPIYYHQELLARIESFKFTTIVGTATIRKTGDMKAIVNITCNNLLNSRWDMEHLRFIWNEITAGAPCCSGLAILEPWIHLSKKTATKACQDMQSGLETYFTWVEGVQFCRTVETNHKLMGAAWWVVFDKKLGEFERLDLDDIASQVDVVVGRYLGIKKEATTPAPADQKSRALATRQSSFIPVRKEQSASTAQLVGKKTSASEPVTRHNTPLSARKKNQAPSAIPILQKAPRSATKAQEYSLSVKLLPLRPALQRFPLRQSSNAILLGPPCSALARASTKDGIVSKQPRESVPNVAQPNVSSLDISQQSAKTSKLKLSLASRSQSLDAAFQPPPSRLVPSKLKPRIKNGMPSGPYIKTTSERSATQRSITSQQFPQTPNPGASKGLTVRSTPDAHATVRTLHRSESVHTPLWEPASTLLRNFSPGELWGSPPMYDTTMLPLVVNGSRPVRFLRPCPEDNSHMGPMNMGSNQDTSVTIQGSSEKESVTRIDGSLTQAEDQEERSLKQQVETNLQ